MESNLLINQEDHKKNFKVIDLTCLRDRELSLQAKALFLEILSRPKGWKIDIRNVVSESTNGKESTYAALKELLQSGYAYKIFKRNRLRQFTVKGLFLTEIPKNFDQAKQYIEKAGWEIIFTNQPETQKRETQTLGNKSHTNKDTSTSLSSKEEEHTASKEADGSTEPSMEQSICFDNLRPIRVSPYRNFTEEAKELFLYWNSKGKPLTVHYERGDTFTRALTNLDLLIRRKYTKEEIKKSIDNYFWLVSWKEFLLIGSKKAGTVVGLPDFIKFGKKMKDLIPQFNPLLIENGVTSWFEECLNTREVLEARWSKLVKDEYPKETKKLKELWNEFGGRKLQGADDENIMRRLAVKAYNYFEKLNGQYQWGTEERYPIARLHHLFDVGQSEGWDWRKVQPSFLLSSKMFTEKLPAHWERIAMAEALSDEQWKEMNDSPEARQRKEFNSHLSYDPNSTRERTLAMIASRAKNQIEETAEELQDY